MNLNHTSLLVNSVLSELGTEILLFLPETDRLSARRVCSLLNHAYIGVSLWAMLRQSFVPSGPSEPSTQVSS